MIEIIGIMGASLILIAWILGLVDELRNHKSLIELRFSIVTLAGTAILVYYSYIIGSSVFLFLNLGIFLTVIFEIIYTVIVSKR